MKTLLALSALLSGLAMPGWAAPPDSSALQASQLISLTRHAANTYYLNGQLGSYGDTNLLLDTGSSYMVINQAMLDALAADGQARYHKDLSGIMADGSRQIVELYNISNIRLGESCWISDVLAAVIPGADRPILGMTLLARLSPFTFSATPAELTLSNCQDQPTASTASLQTQKTPDVATRGRHNALSETAAKSLP